jgi:alkylation response protein AidB-like acyl-CoA dehydrogenase
LCATEGDPYRTWLPRVAEGTLIGGVFSELGNVQAGGGKHETTLKVDRSGYVVNGTKYYSTGALYVDYVAINAATEDGAPATAIVPANREGLHLDDDWDGIGQRLTGTGTTWLVNLRVLPDEVIFHASHPGHLAPFQATFPQLYLTAIIAGILRAVTNDAKALLRGRCPGVTRCPVPGVCGARPHAAFHS